MEKLHLDSEIILKTKACRTCLQAFPQPLKLGFSNVFRARGGLSHKLLNLFCESPRDSESDRLTLGAPSVSNRLDGECRDETRRCECSGGGGGGVTPTDKLNFFI
jgi:hypothetical protein